ncbi:hypothetical protein [Rhizobium leguminosarum]|uniref:hypothetical protein n=1 Tax=Rhizobium leguminosarum TaxID=384 RepID=UPI002E0DD886|nr:hypothetical protein U8Q02_40425 [Rhizobium leguminosarum]
MYLLSTQALMDLICDQPEMSRWVGSVAAAEVHVSAVSVAHVQAEINATPADEGRDELDRALRAFLAYARRANVVEIFDEEAAQVYARLPLGQLLLEDGAELGDMSRMVVSTAIDRNLELVEEPQPYHADVGNLRTVDPAA